MARTNVYYGGTNNRYYQETLLRLIKLDGTSNDRFKGVVLKDELGVANGENEWSGFSTPIRSDGDTWEDLDGNLRIPNSFYGSDVTKLIFENVATANDIVDGTIYTPRMQVATRCLYAGNENNSTDGYWSYLNLSGRTGSGLKLSTTNDTAFNGGFSWNGWHLSTSDFIEDTVDGDIDLSWEFRLRFHHGPAQYSEGYTDEFNDTFVTSNFN